MSLILPEGYDIYLITEIGEELDAEESLELLDFSPESLFEEIRAKSRKMIFSLDPRRKRPVAKSAFTPVISTSSIPEPCVALTSSAASDSATSALREVSQKVQSFPCPSSPELFYPGTLHKTSQHYGSRNPPSTLFYTSLSTSSSSKSSSESDEFEEKDSLQEYPQVRERPLETEEEPCCRKTVKVGLGANARRLYMREYMPEHVIVLRSNSSKERMVNVLREMFPHIRGYVSVMRLHNVKSR
ncbi:unnamed protein product [Caenorhabditis auriculariae]|uniref:Uncharacterized protein n=1 Tax=Caenorhabditis auriculariae TaxID=2777116 RepID=A0A8S1HVE0_9PELO|nr:unnamed protein product [Caenorhabditis auriculariae]